jgi:hypothetical protein
MVKVGNAFNLFRHIVKPPEIIALKLPRMDEIVEEEIEVSVVRRN